MFEMNMVPSREADPTREDNAPCEAERGCVALTARHSAARKKQASFNGKIIAINTFSHIVDNNASLYSGNSF